LKTILSEIDNKNFGLDLFRALAILFVVFGHGFELLNINPPVIFPVDGVDLFFVLSGFLIGRILLKTEPTSTNSLLKETLIFYKRRWFRTLPNYFLFLIINIILVETGFYDGLLNINILAYFVFLQNFRLPLDLMFWESWSLSVEEWFYLLFPLLIFISSLFFKLKSNYKQMYLITCIIFLSVPLLLRLFHYVPTMNDAEIDLFVRKTVIFRLDTIAFGLLGAYFFKFKNNFFYKSAFLLFIIGFIGILTLKSEILNINSFFKQTFLYSLQSMFILFLLPAFYRLKTVPKIIARPIGLISVISYALYLVHMPVLYIIRLYSPESQSSQINLLIYLIISATISFVVYFVWERPMTSLRNKKIKILGFRF